MPLTDETLSTIAEMVPTPFFAYDEGDLKDTFQGLKRHMPDGVDIYYSVKSNPNKAVVATLAGEGAGCEVCSRAELETVFQAGANRRRVIYVGPAKTACDIRRAMMLGVKAIIAESAEELRLIGEIAREHGMIQPVGLRVNPQFQSASVRIRMTGVASQFGIDEPELFEVINQVETDQNLVLVGLHVYLGSRILSEEGVFENTRNILGLARRTCDYLGRPLSFVDVGGGFGVRYFAKERDLDTDKLGVGLTEIFQDYKARYKRTRLIIELGRYLVARAGVMVSGVRCVKNSKGKRFAICDGGSNIFAAAANGSAFRRTWPLRKIGSGGGGEPEPHTLTGPLCTPTDVIGDQVPLPPLTPGDLVCFERTGAYGPSASPVSFLSFGHPAEVLVTKNGPVLVRAADPVELGLAHQTWRPLGEQEERAHAS